jgi:SAM-dependent methyltransferase
MPLFEWFARNQAEEAVFDAAMTSYASAVHLTVLDDYPFSDFSCVADIGSGQGMVLRHILQHHPQVRGIAFDLPQVVEASKATFAEAGLAGRVEVIGGSFFEKVPSGADAYVIGHILHDWDDERSLTLLRKIREAARPGARLLILELVVPEDDSPHYARLMDINMLVSTSGRERTAREYASLIDAAGWSFARVVDGHIATSIVEAVAR